jgi:hypothetical protein
MSLSTAEPKAAPALAPRRRGAWARIAGLAFAVALVLTGCGGGTAESGTKKDNVKGTTAAPGGAAHRPRTLTRPSLGPRAREPEHPPAPGPVAGAPAGNARKQHTRNGTRRLPLG